MLVGYVKIGDFRQITHYNVKTSPVASVFNLIRSQVYDNERPYFQCSTFTVMQRVARVRQLVRLLVVKEYA